VCVVQKVPRQRDRSAIEITPNPAQCRAIAGSGATGMSFASALGAMQITRRRVMDVAIAVAGVMMMVVALFVFDYRTRHIGGDFSTVSEQVNYLAVAVTLVAAQVVRGEYVDHTTMLLFTTTAIVLVVLLMRL
jgi:hypothetical protein